MTAKPEPNEQSNAAGQPSDTGSTPASIKSGENTDALTAAAHAAPKFKRAKCGYEMYNANGSVRLREIGGSISPEQPAAHPNNDAFFESAKLPYPQPAAPDRHFSTQAIEDEKLIAAQQAEIAELKRQLVEAKDDVELLHIKRERAEAERDELKDDAARLDWLERNPRLGEIHIDGKVVDCYLYAVSGAMGVPLRAIIDAMRSKG